MKVAILTFHTALNYGAIMQAYGLYTVLKSKGVDVDILDYRNPEFEEIYHNFRLQGNWLKWLGKKILVFPVMKKRQLSFGSFVEKNMTLSEVYSNETLSQANQVYDLFITGSDQVFNIACAGNTHYFLDFVTNSSKKCSYAASFGKDFVETEYQQQVGNLLADFNCISVREKSGVEIVGKLTGQKAAVHLDPSLLVTKSEWQQLAQSPHSRKPYVLLYMMQDNKRIINFARQLADENDWDLYCLPSGYMTWFSGARFCRGVSPEEWLGLFNEAACVVTNSFHGMAFSINLNRNFYFSYHEGHGKANARLKNLAELCGLAGQNVEHYKHFSAVDFSYANKQLSQQRASAMSYLDSLIQGN